MSEQDKPVSFVNKTRRRLLLGGAAGATSLVTGCDMFSANTHDRDIIPAYDPSLFSEKLRNYMKSLAKMIGAGKPFDKEAAKIVLAAALQEYEAANPDVKPQIKQSGLLRVQEISGKDGPHYVAVYVNFEMKSLVAAKDIMPTKLEDMPILDLTNASRAGAVCVEDKSIAPAVGIKGKKTSMQEENGYLYLAMKLRDNNIHNLIDTIRHTIASTGDINNLKPNQISALQDVPAVMKHLEVGKELFPGLIPPCPLVRVFSDDRLRVRIGDAGGVLGANTYDARGDEWKWAGKLGSPVSSGNQR